MKTTVFIKAHLRLAILAAAFLLFGPAIYSAWAQEEPSANLKLIPSKERIPQADEQPRIAPEYIIPPIRPVSAPVSQDFSPFKAPLIKNLERGKWYVQIGAYERVGHVEDAVSLLGTAYPVVIQNVGTDIDPLFRVLIGPYNQNESKAVLQRFKDSGYEAFLRIRK